MSEKSKGNFFDFIKDVRTDPKLYNKMFDVIKTKGKGITPKGLLEEFHRLGYDGVNLRDSKKILDLVKSGVIDSSKWDWSY
jgi:hypothetical protein